MLFPALKYKEPLVILQQHTAVVFYLDPGQIIVFPVPCCIPLSWCSQLDQCDLFHHPSAGHHLAIVEHCVCDQVVKRVLEGNVVDDIS